MHFHLPKPLHGWRELLGEVGVIVIGVLIALSAEQLVQEVHWRSELTKFRSALDKEAALNLAYYEYRTSQRRCVHSRIAELNRWEAMQRKGQSSSPLQEIGRPTILMFNTTVWRSHNANVTEHMPIETELTYADLYDTFDVLNKEQLDEQEAWQGLAAFNGATHLNAENLMRLSELIYRVKLLDFKLDTFNGPWVRAYAAKLGLGPNWNGYRKFAGTPNPGFCQPLLSNASTR